MTDDADISATRRTTFVAFVIACACAAGLAYLYSKYRVGPAPTPGNVVVAPNLYRRLGLLTICGGLACLLGFPIALFAFLSGLARLFGKR